MKLTTSDTQAIKPFIEKLYKPKRFSHKGQNGKMLIIGGSQLFHASALWSAEIASHIVDMVHFASTTENNAIFQQLKTVYRNGIIVSQNHIPDYAKEDDVILMGPGMVRGEIQNNQKPSPLEEILHNQNEAQITHNLTHYMIEQFPHKRFVFDAGSLQMMKPEWLTELKEKAIVTPHQLEFQTLFGIDLNNKTLEEKADIVTQTAKKYNVVIVLKVAIDIISDGRNTFQIEGGNAGLTKGGSGDILAGLTASLYTKQDALSAAVMASYILKKSADELFTQYGYWYNMANLIDKIPVVMREIAL